ncbi:DUF1579 domain-containing protein [Deinococcus psychrotolerans]|uniref:DUF1579 domain-containing protein n=1 Tax=Deinococcus psychrotolerans TaxID=2489213 RepID=A0A3G8YK96_9DEIO|nr:DUF1579 domain-containing protein [Deinococcus psychrotolerans]AZI41476.1 DUF1579 domain-containing protein [Deinococcus psychrotolerans]
MSGSFKAVFALVALSLSAVAFAQQMSPDQLKADQQKMMAQFSWMNGEWRGPATIFLPDGKTHVITQTEKIGPTQDGILKVMHGRGYEANGTASFDAFAVLAYDSYEKTFSITSFSGGNAGKFMFKPTADGYIWEIPEGPITLRYTAVFKDGTWTETGENITKDQPPVRNFQMVLKRIGDTDWPNANLVPMK